MNYRDLISKVDELEREGQLGDHTYFEALEMLKDVQKDLKRLDDVQHVQRVIKPFLIQWGMMGRVAGRKDLASGWRELGKTLRRSEKEFAVLRGKRLLTMDLDEENLARAVRELFGRLRAIPYVGGRTSILKILHLFNPEVIVMWDSDIEERYRRRNTHIRNSPEGYLEFLKDAQKELKEALKERQEETGKSLDEIEKEIRQRYNNKTLSRIVDEYDWVVAHWFKEEQLKM